MAQNSLLYLALDCLLYMAQDSLFPPKEEPQVPQEPQEPQEPQDQAWNTQARPEEQWLGETPHPTSPSYQQSWENHSQGTDVSEIGTVEDELSVAADSDDASLSALGQQSPLPLEAHASASSVEMGLGIEVWLEQSKARGSGVAADDDEASLSPSEQTLSPTVEADASTSSGGMHSGIGLSGMGSGIPMGVGLSLNHSRAQGSEAAADGDESSLPPAEQTPSPPVEAQTNKSSSGMVLGIGLIVKESHLGQKNCLNEAGPKGLECSQNETP
ncbi:hypothetical protein EJ04DRAFT_569833 [Polyplosphaeria fusca]|uniref:Uncharacterized protein n=1 Tax=Polyplosphaeria fusca TaxID=682080 RepID=A0A9P4QKL8_9PLEO|nr:hypothetical protein EJ04DRAFT_569833 [Polyplosphaeria fusca]